MLGFGRQKSSPDAWDSGYFKGEFGDLDAGKLSYVVEEGRMFLQALWDAQGRLTQKTGYLLGIDVGLLGYVSSQLLSGNQPNVPVPWYFTFLWVYFGVLLLVFIILIPYQLPLKSHAPGTQPADLFTRPVMGHSLPEIVVGRLELYQGSIEYNRDQNTELGWRLKISYFLLIGWPVAAVLYSLILRF